MLTRILISHIVFFFFLCHKLERKEKEKQHNSQDDDFQQGVRSGGQKIPQLKKKMTMSYYE